MHDILIQTEDFDVAEQYAQLRKQSDGVGAIVTFTGLVRDYSDGSLVALELEHYPSMALKSLQHIAQRAEEKWPLKTVSIIHRYGRLTVSDQIVFVGIASGHREAAFNAANFIMDTLKTHTPFWKKETTTTGSHWVEMKSSDKKKAAQWSDGHA